MRLSLKFAIAFLLCMGVVQAIFAYSRVEREVSLFDADLRSDHEAMGRDLATAVAKMWQVGGEENALLFVREANASRSDIQIRWIDRRESITGGLALSPTDLQRLAETDKVQSIEARENGQTILKTYAPVSSSQEHWVGTLELAESMEKAEAYVQTTIYRMAARTGIIIAFTGLVALLLGMWLVARPVKLLVERARQIAAGDFAGRSRLNQSDELGELAREIDAMADQLAQADRRVRNEIQARIEAIEQLRHADRLRTVGQLTSGIAHELGTPLNVVWERAKMIAASPEITPTAASSAKIIVEQSQRMTKIIRQLLDFSRPQSPRKALVDLRHVIQQTLNLLRPALDGRSIALDLPTSAEPIVAPVDVDQIQQVASNLILNAVQAMSPSGGLTIRAGCRPATPPADHGGPRTDYVFFAICDQGCGIPAEHIRRVFEPFFTTKDIGQGTGLGLPISLGIVREHGGWIDVESEPGRGTCFTVWLPKETRTCPIEC